jgi:hypothetical protein
VQEPENLVVSGGAHSSALNPFSTRHLLDTLIEEDQTLILANE